MLEILSEEDVMQEYVLGKIIRYNHRRRIQDESVATHSFFVSLFCLKIMKQIKLGIEEQNQVLILAALHDAAESRTSDIPHDVKKNYPEMDHILERIEKDYYKEMWSEYEKVLNDSTELARDIMKLADSYSVYQYCINEILLGSNSHEMVEIYYDAKDRIEKGTDKINQELKRRNLE